MTAFAHLDHNTETGPSWGSLALDHYLIDHWDSNSDVSDGEQRAALVQKYLTTGSLGRREYAKKAASNATRPTNSQIETILQPLRTSTLRSVAHTLATLPDSSGPIWLRTDYQNQQRHEEFCRLELNCVDSGDGLREDSIILSDERYYNVESWQNVLDFLPEIVVNHHKEQEVAESTYRGGDLRRKYEREYMACESGPEMGDKLPAAQQHCCVARFILIEDAEMYVSDPPLFHALWLDDCGNVVRENRITAEDACDYFAVAAEGAGSVPEIWSKEASVGPKYLPGAEFGPPFLPSPHTGSE